VRRGGSPATVAGRRRWLVATLALGAIAATGCGALRRAPLDVPPGHQAVLGEVLIAGFSQGGGVLDIAREDGSYQHELPVGTGGSQFVITLPPGRYQILRLRVHQGGRTLPEEAWFRVGVGFEVGGTAVYVGTLRIKRVAFARQLYVAVQDEYERTVPAIRARYPDLPPMVARALMRPA
jgi:hypothetical protein